MDGLATLGKANNLLGELSLAKKRLEEQRGFFTKPLREHVKRIETLFRPTIQQVEEADESLRNKVTTYLDVQRAAAEEAAAIENEKAEKAAAKGQEAKAAQHALAAVETVQAATPRTMASDTGSVATKQVDAYEVEDLGAVPREYFVLDEKAVMTAIRSGLRSIPGIRIYKKTQLAVTAA